MKAVIYHWMKDSWLHVFPGDFPELDWVVAETVEDVAEAIADADIFLVTNRSCTPELGKAVRRGGRLKWIHFLTAGFELGLAMGLPEGPAVSHAPGIKAGMVSEHALALLLALVRRVPSCRAEQRAHRWAREQISRDMRTLHEATVCIVGLGQVGRAVAHKLQAFDARVIAVTRAGKAGGPVATVFPRERMAEALAQADAVVLCTNEDESSVRLIGGAALAAMKPGAFLVNVARGGLVDEAALIAALHRGHLAGAGLDVFAEEPLPEQSPLWDMPNVIVSPHSAGAGLSGYAAHKALFAANLARLREGKPLLHQYRAART